LLKKEKAVKKIMIVTVNKNDSGRHIGWDEMGFIKIDL